MHCWKGSRAPRTYSRNPTWHVVAIFFIIRAEHFLQSRFLVEFHEQGDGSHHDQNNHECTVACVPEYNPQARPAEEESDVHRVSDIAIKSDHDQPLRRNNWRWSSPPRAAEI